MTARIGRAVRVAVRSFRREVRFFCALVVFAASASTCLAQQASISTWDAADFRVWTYIPYWTTNSQITSFANDGMYKHVSDVFYFSGVRPNADGTLYYYSNPAQTETAQLHLTTLKNQAAAHGFRLQMSMFDVPPGTTVESVWNSITSVAANRARFVTNVTNLLQTYNMTGFNLDWERPNTVAEWGNYTQLAKDLQVALGTKEVSVCDYGGTDPLWDDSSVFDANAYDQLFIMSYHYPAFHANPNPWNNSNSFIDSKLDISENDPSQAFTADQLTLGIGTYGTSSTTTSKTLKSIVAAVPDLAYNATSYTNGTHTWTIESREQVREKTQLALDRGLGGVFSWTLHNDATNERGLHRVMHHYIAFKTGTPDLNLDGKVNATDATDLANKMGTVTGVAGTDPGAPFDEFYLKGNWQNGDRDGDGFVDQEDADWLAGRFASLGVNLPDRLAYSGTFENFQNSRGTTGRWRAKRESGGNLRETGNFTQNGASGLTWTGTNVGADKHSNDSITIRNQNSAEATAGLNALPRMLNVDLSSPIDLSQNKDTYFTFLVRGNTGSLSSSQLSSNNRILALEFLDSAGVNQFDFSLRGQQQRFAIQSQADSAGQDVSATGFLANTTYLVVGKIAGNGAAANIMKASIFPSGATVRNFASTSFTWALSAQSSAGFNPIITQLQFSSLYEANYTVSNVWIGSAADFFALPSSAAGDFNGDGVVDTGDFLVWNKTMNQTGSLLPADGNGNGKVDQADYLVWQQNFGRIVGGGSGGESLTDSSQSTVPEPAGLVLLLVGSIMGIVCHRR